MTDAELLDAIARDPEHGIRLVIDCHGGVLLGRLQRYAHELGQAKEDAEDVFQSALMRLVDPRRRQEVVAAGGEILPWLSRWGRWQLGDLARKRRREAAWQPEPVDPAALGEPSAAAQVLAETRDELNPRDQLVLSLKYEQQLTYPELAERLGQPVSTVKKAVHDAKARLKRRLALRGLEFD